MPVPTADVAVPNVKVYSRTVGTLLLLSKKNFYSLAYYKIWTVLTTMFTRGVMANAFKSNM